MDGLPLPLQRFHAQHGTAKTAVASLTCASPVLLVLFHVVTLGHVLMYSVPLMVVLALWQAEKELSKED